MSLPDLIEIIPLTRPVQAEITVPGSKSITNRALILAALADGQTSLKGALWSEDTQIMVEALLKLGFNVKVEPDPDDSCNRTITVDGLRGQIPRAGTAENPLELFVGNAGTAARFLAAFVCLGHGSYRLHGVARMHERPQAALFKALRELGYLVESPNDRLPATIHGDGPRNASCTVSIEESSQFASALLLSARAGAWRVNIVGESEEESPYVQMTTKLIERFPAGGGAFAIEPDTSSGSYFAAADWLLSRDGPNPQMDQVLVAHWPASDWQIDSRFPEYRGRIGPISRLTDLGDSIMTSIVLAPFSGAPHSGPIVFTDLARLRLQETDRVTALRDELRKCGVRVEERGDDLAVYHGIQSPREPIETYDDHRIAMCFAILGLKLRGIKIMNSSCVKKTFPNFFQKLAAPPTRGLGVEIQDGRGRRLAVNELFAD